METKNVMIVGVGGQGSLLASKLLGRLLLTRGYDIKVSEVHGMSQRGGSVVTYVRYGEKVYSPIIDKGEADYIISPFLVTIPYDGKYDVDATSKPALDVIPQETEPTDPPPPDVPQTGQLEWPRKPAPVAGKCAGPGKIHVRAG